MKFNHNILLHNPRCKKSREAIEFLKFHNLDFEILLYMKDGLEITQINEIVFKLNVNPIDLVRTREKIWEENYKSEKSSNNEIIGLLHKFPNLIKRSIFISKNKAIIAIPPEKINKII